MRGHGSEHEREHLQHMLSDFGSNALLERGVTLIVEIHDERDGGIEVPAQFEILRDAAQGLVRFAQQRFLLLTSSSNIARAFYIAQPSCMPIHEAENAID